MSEQDSASITEVSSKAPPQLGEVLTAQRELKNMTVGEVANQLRLGVRQVEALEANDFAKLPESMITRGFIRNYARLLGVDAEPLILAHRALSGADQPQSLNISSENISITNHHVTPWFKILTVLLLILLLVFGLSYYVQHPFTHVASFDQLGTNNAISTKGANAEPSPEAMQAPVMEKLPEPALPIAERMTESELAAASTQSQTVDSTTDAKFEQSLAQNEVLNANSAKINEGAKLESADAVNVGATQANGVVSASTQIVLELIFTEESWVSVLDGDNKEIYKKLSPAGASEKIVGKPPFNLHIGNAGGTQVNYKGKSVDLTPYTRNNIARITLSLEKN